MKLLIPIPIIALLTALSGCAKDYTLAPHDNSAQITLTTKIPKELEAETIQVMYCSTLCTFTNRTAT